MPAAQRSAATPLALAWAALIVYASLYPFGPWRALPAAQPLEWLILPWPRYWGAFDLWSNFLGYLPMGALAFGALSRSGASDLGALTGAFAAGSLLSLGMEELQNFLPQRVPSSVDWALNTAGTLAGALAALATRRAGWVGRWQALRERWFVPHCAAALALLMLWPIGLLFPAPLPLGLGQVLVRLPGLVAPIVEGSFLAPWLEEAGPILEAHAPRIGLLSPAAETVAVALGLLAPCLLAYSVALPGLRRRIVMPLGAAALGFAATTLSTALNFGPEHMLAWVTRSALPGLALGVVSAWLLSALPRRIVAGVGLVALTALIALVTLAPLDPYYAESLQGWEQGRFIRFHGVAQWIGWLWPFAAAAVLLARLGAAEG